MIYLWHLIIGRPHVSVKVLRFLFVSAMRMYQCYSFIVFGIFCIPIAILNVRIYGFYPFPPPLVQIVHHKSLFIEDSLFHQTNTAESTALSIYRNNETRRAKRQKLDDIKENNKVWGATKRTHTNHTVQERRSHAHSLQKNQRYSKRPTLRTTASSSPVP